MPIQPYDSNTAGSTSGAVQSVNGKSGAVTISKSDVSLGNCDNTSDSLKPVSTAQRTAIDLVTSQTDTKLANYILASKMAAASGVATLDATGTLTSAQIPSSILSGLKPKGAWNASTNTPTLTTTPSTNGDFYRVSVAGTSSAPTGSSYTYNVGDWIQSNGTVWQVTPNTFNDATTSTKGIVQLAGDLAGGAAAPLVAKLNSVALPTLPPTAAGNYLRATGVNNLEYSNIKPSDLPAASTSAVGGLQLGGDLSGNSTAQTVAKVNGWTVGNEPTSANQVLAVTDYANKTLGYVAQSGGGGVAASYMRASGSGQQAITGITMAAFNVVSSYGSDISLVSNCFLLKSGKTYSLKGSVGGVNFTTTGNSYMYAQWRTGQTAGSGTFLGNPANLESSAQSSQNQRATYIAEAEFTPSSDTYVHLDISTIGTNCYIGSGTVASAWIEVLSGAAAVTGQSVDYAACTAANTTSTGALVLTRASGNIVVSGNNITLSAGKTYYLSSVLSFRSATYAVWQWQTSSGALLPGVSLGNSAGFSSTDPLAPATACGFYTPTVDTQVQINVTSISGASGLSTDKSSITVQQVGTSSVIDMIGATASAPGVRGTVPAPAIGKQRAYLKGDGAWDDGAWTSYTPTITGSVSNPTLATTKTLNSRYRVVGKNLEISFTYYAASSTGSAAGSGAYLFSLPSGFTIDTTLANLPSTVSATLGSFSGFDASTLGSGMLGSSTNVASCFVVPATTTTLAVVLHTPAGGTNYCAMMGSPNFSIATAGCFVKFTCSVPIL